jgi:uncharacterized protein involved in exopolysaccharide biosynthesis
MSFIVFIKILLRNWLWLGTIPVVTAVSIFYFTRKQDKEYAADTVIYTGINSGFNLKEETRGDFYSSSKNFANFLTLFNSRNTRQEVAFHLLARHITNKDHDPTLQSWATFVRLHELIDLPTRANLVGRSLEETVQRITDLYHSNDTNVIYKILNSEEQGYSLKALSKLSAAQISNSDLMKVDYVTNDAAICRQTLEILSEVFIRQHKSLLEGQNESVLDYFQSATGKSARRLEKAEKNLLGFQKKNNIINYQEQANQVALEKQRLVQDFNQLELEYAGTQASLLEVERNLKKEGNNLPNSQEVLHLRNQISNLNTRITEYEIFHKVKPGAAPSAALASLKRQAENTEGLLRKSLDTYSTKITSLQSLPIKELLNEWIKDAVQAEKLKGQLVVMRQQNQIFAREAEKMAPLGVELRQFEREKELAEKEYFNLLNGLTQSKLNQQNIALTSQLKVVDPPITPLKPLSSKRTILVLAGAVGAFIAVLAAIIGAEFLDGSLKTPMRATQQTGLPVFGVVPQCGSSKNQPLPETKKTEDQLARKLLLRRQQKGPAAGPFIVGVLSSAAGEGKTTLIQTLAQRLQAYQIDAQVLLPENHESQVQEKSSSTLYSSLLGLSPQALITDLASRPFSDQAVVLVEFPPLLEAVYPVSLLRHLDLILLTIKADRSWQQDDIDILNRVRQVTASPIEVVLNGMLAKYTEEFRIRLLPRLRRNKKAPAVAVEDPWVGELAVHV